MKICKINRRHPGKLILATAFATVLMAPMATMAQAAVIDFNALTDPDGLGGVARGSTYTEDGFVLDDLSATSFFSIHSPNSGFTGTVSFFNNTVDGVTRLTKDGGGAFDLASIDLDSLNSGVAVGVNFTGTLADASTVTQSFTTDATFPGLQTFSFGTAFDNVVQVEWTQIDPFHSFDNIVVNPVVAGSVPEPMTLSLLGAGLAGVALARRRKPSRA